MTYELWSVAKPYNMKRLAMPNITIATTSHCITAPVGSIGYFPGTRTFRISDGAREFIPMLQ